MGLVENLLNLKNHYQNIQRERKLKEQQFVQEREKLSIEKAKVDSSLLLNKAKAQESLNKSSLLRSETLGQNITNTGQKIENMNALRSPDMYGVDPKKLPQQNQQDASKKIEPVLRPQAQNVGKLPTDPLAYKLGQGARQLQISPDPNFKDVSQIQVPTDQRMRTAVDEAQREREEYQEKLPEIIQERLKIRNEFSKQKQIYKKKIESLDNEYENLRMNPPEYRKSLSSLGLIKKTGALIHAGMFGDLYKEPTEMLDKMVNRELATQKQLYQAKKTHFDRFGKQQMTIYNKMLDILDDEESAELATLNAIMKDQLVPIQHAAARITDEKKLSTWQKTIFDMKTKIAKNENDLKIKMWEKRQDLGIKNIKLGIDQQKELRTKKEGTIFLGRDDPQGFYIGKKAKEKFDTDVAVGTEVVQSMNYLGDLTKQINALKASKAFVAGTPDVVSKVGNEELRVFDIVNKTLHKMALKSRIDFTGGGNMSDQEREILLDFYEVTDRGRILKDTNQITGMLRKKYKGRYKTVFNVIKSASFFKAVHEAQTKAPVLRKEYKNLFRKVGQQMGVTNSDILKYTKQYERNKLKTIIRRNITRKK